MWRKSAPVGRSTLGDFRKMRLGFAHLRPAQVQALGESRRHKAGIRRWRTRLHTPLKLGMSVDQRKVLVTGVGTWGF